MAIFGRVLGEKVRQTVGFTGKIDPTPNDDYMKPLKRCVTSDWAVVASLRPTGLSWLRFVWPFP